MLNRKNLPIWIVLFVVLLGGVIYALSHKKKKSERNFKLELVDVPVKEIDKIVFQLPHASYPFVFTKKSGEWKITVNGKHYDVDTLLIRRMLRSCTNMRSLRVVASDASRWAEYKVADTNATHVEYFVKGEKEAGLYVGNYYYLAQQSQNSLQNSRGEGIMTTYVREEGSPKTYSVSGYLQSNFTDDVTYYRRKNLFKARKTKITRVYAEFADGMKYDIRRVRPGVFTIDGMPADSNAISKFFHAADNINSRDLLDDVDPSQLPSAYDMIRFEGENISPVVVKAYAVEDERNHVLTSSANPGAYFGDPINRLYRMMFKSRDFYLGKAPR
ncbi:MAG: hypothetical protein CSA95_07785 [Bacteroidetes bacterium]|nr:MAG: hypothetical protein CSA95_07785 [Bacteroidota bacterium]